MSVYVDDYQALYGRMKMVHMIADSSDELLAMADKIGVQRKWIQQAGTHREHFDICMSKRELALAAGAIEISSKLLVMKTINRRSRSQDRGRTGTSREGEK